MTDPWGEHQPGAPVEPGLPLPPRLARLAEVAASGAALHTVGPARDQRRNWIYYGFEAAQAVAWAATGLTPSQARLRRATVKRPGDVGAGQRVPPELLAGRRYVAYSATADGELSHPEWDELADPPGTRGRFARRRARDRDPWINTD